MSETWVNSWTELQEQVFESSWMPELRRFRSPFAYRGMADAANRLQTSLSRLGGDYAAKEEHLLRNFRKYASRHFVENGSAWDWLALAKHHGLPTRLLDWSFSPLVAMHFMTQDPDDFDIDGVIWAVNYNQVHQYLPEALKDVLPEASVVFTAEMLAEKAASLDDIDRLSQQKFMVFFEPPSIDDRIVNQHALFSFLSDPGGDPEEWLSQYPDLLRKICVPARLKWEIRDKLDQSNINERVLFPGLDGLSSWLKRHYQTRV